MDDKELALLYRASLLAQAEALKNQRAAILSIVSALEKKYNIEPKKGNNHDRSSSTKNSIDKSPNYSPKEN